MERKLYTFLIISEVRGKVYKIEFPYYVAHLLLGLSIGAIVTVAALATSYTRMLLKVSNYNDVRADREALKSNYRVLQKVVTETNAKLGSLESLATDVALSYGFGEARHEKFPQSILAMAAQENPALDSGYHASLYAFNLLKITAFKGSSKTISPSLFAVSDRSSVPSIWPVHGAVSAGFGERIDPLNGEGAFHSGMDIAAPTGTEVMASADGMVLSAGPEAGYGNAILLDHGNGMTTKYGHLSEIDIVVGQEVKRGQIIGAVGSTGRTTGPHLHYEVHIHDAPVNPATYLHG
ncbi:MAG: M23 family peptidase [Acidobacteria bacterium]|nr:MAG: M23 family peptidase [Acidobacteriota bacterium]